MHSSDVEGGYDTPFGEPFAPRGMADLRTHCSSGTHHIDGSTSVESPDPAWDADDIPDDLVPNRTDLMGGMSERV